MNKIKNKENPSMDELIHWFSTSYPEIVSQMDQKHAIQTGKPNPYHLENSIWTHTMMVCLLARDSHKINKISALFHDMGKPEAREVKKDRVRFFGHEGLSFWKAVDPLYDLLYQGVINKSEMAEILKIISLHGSLFDHIRDGKEHKPETIVQMFDTLPEYTRYIDQVRFDAGGRFTSKSRTGGVLGEDIFNLGTFNTNNFLNNENELDKVLKTNKTNKEKNLTLLVGLPCSGKSTYLNELYDLDTPDTLTHVIISRDNLLLEYSKEKGLKGSYSEIFQMLSKKDHRNIDQILLGRYNKALKDNKDIIIDMTNMSKKSRRKWLNHSRTKQYKKIAKIFVQGESILDYRNTVRSRTGKTIPDYVYRTMKASFMVPTRLEFDEIEYLID